MGRIITKGYTIANESIIVKVPLREGSLCEGSLREVVDMRVLYII